MLTIHLKKHKNCIDLPDVIQHLGERASYDIHNVQSISAGGDEFDQIACLYPHLVPQTRNCGIFYGDIARTILSNL